MGLENVQPLLALVALMVVVATLSLILARRTNRLSTAKFPLAGVRQATEAIAAQRERRELIRTTLDEAIKLSNAEVAALVLRNEVDNTADVHTLLQGQLRTDRIALSTRLPGRDSGEAQATKSRGNGSQAYQPPPNLPGYYPQIKGVIGTTLRAQGRVFGELFVANKPTGFTGEDEDLVLLLANQISPAFENQMLAEQLKRGYMETIEALVMAIEAKDGYTRGHSEQVIKYAVAIANEMGLPAEQVEDIRVGAVLHDIGKIGVSEAIINKPGPLTDEEWRLMRDHPRMATKIIDSFNRSRDILLMVYHHHESYDGRGYPTGIKGNDIPLSARILKVADSFEAMTSKRPYQRTKTFEEALVELKNCSGRQFDPLIVAAFERALINRSHGLDEIALLSSRRGTGQGSGGRRSAVRWNRCGVDGREPTGEHNEGSPRAKARAALPEGRGKPAWCRCMSPGRGEGWSIPSTQPPSISDPWRSDPSTKSTKSPAASSSRVFNPVKCAIFRSTCRACSSKTFRTLSLFSDAGRSLSLISRSVLICRVWKPRLCIWRTKRKSLICTIPNIR
ncbi:MAG: HD domain-containing protein [Chloroflexi bacterium]|nr:HD domain-containing protein [Chloroflexota bacterium]